MLPLDLDLGFNASAGFHTYQIVWGSGYIDWYVDGRKIKGIRTDGIPNQNLQIYCNIWFPNPDWRPYSGNLYAKGPGTPTRVAYIDYISYYPFHPYDRLCSTQKLRRADQKEALASYQSVLLLDGVRPEMKRTAKGRIETNLLP